MSAYYNEHDPKAAEWLRELIKSGLIADGYVDERSIHDVRGGDLEGFRQVHLFAGIGGWSYALRLAGVPEDEPIWTGSCPCQPFSDSGKRKGVRDERHLWPEMCRLVAERGPATVFGEQVASKLGRRWFAGVRADLAALDYAAGGADLCAAGVGAPHRRQRLYWVAVSESERRGARALLHDEHKARDTRLGDGSIAGGMEFSEGDGREQRRTESEGRSIVVGCGSSGMGNADFSGSFQGRQSSKTPCQAPRATGGSIHSWAPAQWIECRDGKSRRAPLEPEFFPLAHRVPGRVGLLRGYGNAIVPPLAAEFIRAALEAIN